MEQTQLTSQKKTCSHNCAADSFAVWTVLYSGLCFCFLLLKLFLTKQNHVRVFYGTKMKILQTKSKLEMAIFQLIPRNEIYLQMVVLIIYRLN